MSEEITKDLEKIAPKRWKRYPRYKDSGVEWIGEIPTNWRVYRLKELAKINPSKTEKNHLPDDLEVSFVPMESIGEYGGISGAEAKKLLDVKQGYTYFAEGDLIVAKITPCFENYKGAIASDLVNGIGFGTTELFVLRPNERSDSRYLFYVSISKAFRETGSKIMHGAAGQKRITVDFINNYPVALPKPEEQSQIVGFLDETLKRVDSLITKKQRLIELLKEKRAVIISRAVTKGLDPNAPMKDSGIEWIGEIPEGWGVAKLKRAVNHVGRGISPNYAEKSSIAVINQACIYWEGISEDDLKYHEETDISELRKGLLKKGDLLLNSTGTGTLGRALLFNLDRMCIADSHVTIVRCDRKLLIPSFLRLLVETPLYQGKILNELVAGSTNQIELSREKLRDLIVVLPPIEEQERVVAYVTERNYKIDSFISKIEKSIELLKEYRSALITAAVTGKIDVREEVP